MQIEKKIELIKDLLLNIENVEYGKDDHLKKLIESRIRVIFGENSVQHNNIASAGPPPMLFNNNAERYAFENFQSYWIEVKDYLKVFLDELQLEKENLSHPNTTGNNNSVNTEGTMDHLKECLVNNIYDFVIKSWNPSYEDYSRYIPDYLKDYIKEKDNYTCQICGRHFDDPKDLVADHIFPYCFGGKNERYNLMALCTKCNGNKSNSLNFFQNAGKTKIRDSIKKWVDELKMCNQFGEWLKEENHELLERLKTTKKSKKSSKKSKTK